jgi:predicted nucleic acid-binding protein
MIEPARSRAVFDINVIIAAIKARNPASPTAELIRRWLAGEFYLLYSTALLEEYAEKLTARNVPPNQTPY